MAFHATGKIDFDCFLWLVSEQEQSSFNSFGVSIILISSMMSVMGRCIECECFWCLFSVVAGLDFL